MVTTALILEYGPLRCLTALLSATHLRNVDACERTKVHSIPGCTWDSEPQRCPKIPGKVVFRMSLRSFLQGCGGLPPGILSHITWFFKPLHLVFWAKKPGTSGYMF